MTHKSVTVDCLECDSTYGVDYKEGLVSKDLPEHCPFCGEPIEEFSESYIEDDDNELDTGEWD